LHYFEMLSQVLQIDEGLDVGFFVGRVAVLCFNFLKWASFESSNFNPKLVVVIGGNQVAIAQ